MGARGFGIAIACAGDLATTLVGTPGLGAVLENVFGAAIAFAKGYGVVLAIICAWPCDCSCKQIHAGDIAAACTGVPPRLPTFIPTKMQPKKMEVLVYST